MTPLPQDANDPPRYQPPAGLTIEEHGPRRRRRRWFIGVILGTVFVALLAMVVYVTAPESSYLKI